MVPEDVGIDTSQAVATESEQDEDGALTAEDLVPGPEDAVRCVFCGFPVAGGEGHSQTEEGPHSVCVDNWRQLALSLANERPCPFIG